MTAITEYGKGYKDGYYKAMHSVYLSIRERHRSLSTPNIISPYQGILDGLEIILKSHNEDLVK